MALYDHVLFCSLTMIGLFGVYCGTAYTLRLTFSDFGDGSWHVFFMFGLE